MPSFSPSKNHSRYRVYLGVPFQALGCRKDVIDCLTRAGLFYFLAEETSAARADFRRAIQQEMADSDLFILLLDQNLDRVRVREEPLAQLEYAAAREAGKPILVYLSAGDTSAEMDDATLDFANRVRADETCVQLNDEHDLPTLLVADIFSLVASLPNLTCWVRSDINSAKLDSIAQQKAVVDANLQRASKIIQQYESSLEVGLRDQIIGPLIDIGLRPNISGQVYRFALPQAPGAERGHDQMEFQYFIDRFVPYQCGAVYDRRLDLTWMMVKEQSFSWSDACNWRKHLSPENKDHILCLQSQSGVDGDTAWRLPEIEELMTLLADRKQGYDYFDKLIFPGDVHWFWSASFSKNDNKAYYIETTEGKVLKDELNHLNAVLLCFDGKPDHLGDIVHVFRDQDSEQETEALRKANLSRHLYGIFLSICAAEPTDVTVMDEVQGMLHRSGYVVSGNLTRTARTYPRGEDLARQLENQDCYILVLERGATPEALESASRELLVARSLGLPIFIYHNYQDAQSAVSQTKLKLCADELDRLSRYRDVRSLAFDVVEDMNRGIDRNVSLGWIRHAIFQTINENIDKINKLWKLTEESESALNEFIRRCNVKGLRQAFEQCGIVAAKPKYGEHAWFVSRDNSITRLYLQKELSPEYKLPILFEKLPNRFELLEETPDYRVVQDNYLNLRWWPLGLKKTSYEEALDFARQVSKQRGEKWRVPTVEEMVTLLTRTRNNRKYMDELVFPKGRWFWTSSRNENLVYYVDYNYMHGSINREDLSLYADEFPIARKKSVVLVSDPENGSAAGQPVRSHSAVKPVGGKMDALAIPVLMQTVEFLFGEAAKVLDERRERRKEQKSTAPAPAAGVPALDEVLHAPVNLTIWSDRQAEAEHLNELLRAHTKTYRILQKQIAAYTEADAPPIKISQRDEALEGIITTTHKLEKLLSSVYDRKIEVGLGED